MSAADFEGTFSSFALPACKVDEVDDVGALLSSAVAILNTASLFAARRGYAFRLKETVYSPLSTPAKMKTYHITDLTDMKAL